MVIGLAGQSCADIATGGERAQNNRREILNMHERLSVPWDQSIRSNWKCGRVVYVNFITSAPAMQ